MENHLIKRNHDEPWRCVGYRLSLGTPPAPPLGRLTTPLLRFQQGVIVLIQDKGVQSWKHYNTKTQAINGAHLRGSSRPPRRAPAGKTGDRARACLH